MRCLHKVYKINLCKNCQEIVKFHKKHSEKTTKITIILIDCVLTIAHARVKIKVGEVFATDGIAGITAWEQKRNLSSVWAVLPHKGSTAFFCFKPPKQ